MTEIEFVAKWEARAAEYEELGMTANGARLCRALLADFGLLRATKEAEVLSLSEAATWSGYSQAHLARLVKEGKLKTLRQAGSRGRLSFRRADLPRKPGALHPSRAGVHELASRLFGGKEGHHGRS